MRAARLAALLEKLCGQPVRQKGSHRQCARPDGIGTFTFAFHDRETCKGALTPTQNRYGCYPVTAAPRIPLNSGNAPAAVIDLGTSVLLRPAGGLLDGNGQP
jgi:predicted RNA binding protein YcfA (HicA-like mRNA interferase family)